MTPRMHSPPDAGQPARKTPHVHLLAVLLVAALAGCAIKEPIVRPDQTLPAAWAEPAAMASAPLPDAW